MCIFIFYELKLFALKVWLSRMDGHMGFANSLALNIAGVSNHTRRPIGGAIMKDSDGGKFFLVLFFQLFDLMLSVNLLEKMVHYN